MNPRNSPGCQRYYLVLSRKILKNDEGWASLAEEWSNYENNFKNLAQQHEEKKRADKLEELYLERFNKGFRKEGVNGFYDLALGPEFKLLRIQAIRDHVENELLEDFNNGRMSLQEISTLLGNLIDYAQDLLATLESNEKPLGYKKCKERVELENTPNAGKSAKSIRVAYNPGFPI